MRQFHILTLLLTAAAVLCCAGTPCAAHDQVTIAPQNPEFTAFIQSQLTQPRVQQTEEGYPLGWVPPPIDLSHASAAQVQSDFPILGYPTSYDLRDISGKLSPVRNQGSCGSCWSFAAYGSLESSLRPSETWNFSEMDLICEHGYDLDPCYGGNAFMTTGYLARWDGPVEETCYPYNPPNCVSPRPVCGVVKHVQQAIFVPDRSGSLDNDYIKQMVMDYGAVQTSFYWNSSYHNYSTDSFYYSGTATSNHAVCIVGWDDDYPAGNFLSTPPGNGAFIIRNSWGSSWGDGGYFYISYYDSKIGWDNAVFPNAEPTDNYDVIHQLDPLGWVSSIGYGSTSAWGANMFTADQTQIIEAVSTYTASPGSSYSVYVYVNPTSSPRTGSLAASQSGALPYFGYDTITLNSPVLVQAGEDFSVVIKLTTPGYTYPVPFELASSGYTSAASANPGESYISSNGSSWTDITNYYSTANVCIKAFGSSATVAIPTFAPGGGTYASPQSVVVSCATSGAAIHYTTDGSDPTESDPVVASGGTVLIDQPLTLKARAFYTGYAQSPVASADYCISQPVLRVDGGAAGPAHDGLSWTTAYLTVQEAIDAAANCDVVEVWVAEGTYVENITLKDKVALYGGFAGDETARTERDWAVHETVIDGNRAASVVSILAVAGPDTRVDGFTITNGHADRGGGVYCGDTSSCILTNNTITKNSADLEGGGIYCAASSSPVIAANFITHNQAQFGGGVFTHWAFAKITSNAIFGNTAEIDGAGVFSGQFSSDSISNNTIADNSAGQRGGGIHCAADNYAAVASCTITHNSAPEGAAISRDPTSYAVVSHCCFFENDALPFHPTGWNPVGSDNNISTDPMFLAPWVDDYHLRPGSPCIDAGDNAFVEPGALDLDGKDRVLPAGGTVDIGCFEWDANPYWVRKISQARAIPEGFNIELRGKPITAAFPNAFYIQQPNRTCGLRIASSQPVDPGDSTTVTGQMNLDGPERALLAASASIEPGAEEMIPNPLAVVVKGIGGGDYFWNHNGENCGVQAVTGASGFNTIGLLVRAAGMVSGSGGGWFTLDDGSAVPITVVLPAGVSAPGIGSCAVVTGISSCEDSGGDVTAVLRVRTEQDILTL